MPEQTSEKPENSKPEADKSQSPKAASKDNDVIDAKGGHADVGGAKLADGTDAPKQGDKGSESAAAAYDISFFRQVSRLPEDQTFAFAKWAEREKLGKAPLADWRKRLLDFRNRIV